MQIVVFTDGGARGNPGPAAIGGVVLRENQTVLHEFSEYIGVGTNNEAEYKAIIQAVAWLSENIDQEISAVSFKLDSMLVVQQLGRKWRIKEARLQTLAASCWSLLEKLSIPYSFHHVPREQNKLADALVNQALDSHLA